MSSRPVRPVMHRPIPLRSLRNLPSPPFPSFPSLPFPSVLPSPPIFFSSLFCPVVVYHLYYPTSLVEFHLNYLPSKGLEELGWFRQQPLAQASMQTKCEDGDWRLEEVGEHARTVTSD